LPFILFYLKSFGLQSFAKFFQIFGNLFEIYSIIKQFQVFPIFAPKEKKTDALVRDSLINLIDLIMIILILIKLITIKLITSLLNVFEQNISPNSFLKFFFVNTVRKFNPQKENKNKIKCALRRDSLINLMV